MKQQDAKPEQALPHDLILEGRNKLTVTGVCCENRTSANMHTFGQVFLQQCD